MNTDMRSLQRAAGAALLILSTLTFVGPADAQPGTSGKADFEMAADRSAYAAGDTVRLAALVEVESRWHINSNQPAQEYLIPTELKLELPAGWEAATFSYPSDKAYQFPFETEPVLVYDETFEIFAELTLPAGLGDGPIPIDATLHYQACDDRQCVAPTSLTKSFEIVIGPGGEPTHASLFGGGGSTGASGSTTKTSTAAGGGNLFTMLLLGLLGGFILNAMPCVLPVLSLKVFGLVKSAGQGRSQLVTGAAATTFGILVSFWALALAAVLAAKAGAAVGWGVQFQQPGFVAFLAVVVVLFSLNMWELFEIPLPQSLARVGSSGPTEGLGGHFASGLFATLMATPCSAPFLGTAVGFALGQPAHTIFLVFTAIGLGLALPYILLAVIPGAAAWLPKPGAWMNTFRHIMGFLLAAAAVWLFYVLAGQISSEHIAFVQLALLGLALFVWLAKGAPQSSGRKRFALIGALIAAGGSIFLAAAAPPVSSSVDGSSLVSWVAFDETEAKSLADDGKMVFVDFTADWCLTCKANERLVIETPEIAGAFEEKGVVAMKGDWTNRDDTITEFLARYGRSAVPFYVLFRPGQEPYAFGELLTKSGILEALEESSAGG